MKWILKGWTMSMIKGDPFRKDWNVLDSITDVALVALVWICMSQVTLIA